MFANTVQPSVISLFSSSSSNPLQLFSQHVDPSPAFRSDSFIHFLSDSANTPAPPSPGALIQSFSLTHEASHSHQRNSGNKDEGRTLCQTVLHMQSPTLRTTYIRCPPLGSDAELGLTLPWLHMQVRGLGKEWAFEVGLKDKAGRKGVVRCSTFQKEAALSTSHNPPLLHVPLRFPPTSFQLLTAWTTISLDLGHIVKQFRIVGATQPAISPTFAENPDGTEIPLSAPLPSGGLGSILYVKVFANCRLRRLWFSEERRGSLPWEFELYASHE